METRCGAFSGDFRTRWLLREASDRHPLFCPFVKSLLLTLLISQAAGPHSRAAPVPLPVILQHVFVCMLIGKGAGATGPQACSERECEGHLRNSHLINVRNFNCFFLYFLSFLFVPAL